MCYPLDSWILPLPFIRQRPLSRFLVLIHTLCSFECLNFFFSFFLSFPRFPSSVPSPLTLETLCPLNFLWYRCCVRWMGPAGGCRSKKWLRKLLFDQGWSSPSTRLGLSSNLGKSRWEQTDVYHSFLLYLSSIYCRETTKDTNGFFLRRTGTKRNLKRSRTTNSWN